MLMKRRTPGLFLAALLLTTQLTHPARAADTTPEQAKALEADLRAWMAGLLSPAVDVGPRPVEVTPSGDYLAVRIPAPAMISAMGIVEPGLAVTLKAKPLDGGRWAIDDLKLPSPLKVMTPGTTDKTSILDWSIDSQDYHAVFDPSFATTSSFDSTWRGYRTHATTQSTFVTRSSGHSALQPADKGRVNLISESSGEKLDASITAPNMPPVTYKANTVRSSTKVQGLSPSNLATIVRSIAGLVGTAKTADPNATGPNDEQRQLARTGVLALRDVLASVDATTTFEGLTIDAMGQSATLKKGSAGLSFATPESKLTLSSAIELEGFASAAVPQGPFRDYLPRRILIKPRVGGFPSEDAMRLLLRAIDSDPKDLPAVQEDAMRVLAANPVEIAIDELVIDLGRASLQANGSVDITSPDDISGEAEISMKGLDALIRRANSDPELKQIAPALFFVKGLAKKDGDAYTWTINYENGKVTVNDTDVSDMAGMSK